MKTKKHLSLMSEVLIGSIGSLLIVTLFIFTSYTIVMRRFIKRSTITFETTISEISSFQEQMKNLSSTVTEQSRRAEQILSSLTDIKNSSINVKENAAVISSGTSQVEENCRTLSQMQGEVDSGIQSCDSSSKNLTKTSQSMTDISNQAQESVGLLTEAVSKFKV